MDTNNLRNISRIIPSDKDKKITTLLSFAQSNRSIADPWYTGNFDDTYNDVLLGCNALFQYIKNTGSI